MKIHKRGSETVERYIGFGQYEKIHAPLCEGAKGLWRGRSYLITKHWKHVTCKNCLRLRKSEGQ
jgi:hypothetical protein